jgi:hypothetical protein
MNAHGAIKNVLAGADMLTTRYLEDLTDAELMVRAVPGTNHVAWQLGHLIVAEHGMVDSACPGVMPALPAGFAEKHAKETATSDDAGAFLKKAQYLDAYRQQRAGTLKALEGLSEADLDRPGPEKYRGFLDTLGALFCMQATHWLMHAGQWAIVRRKLGRKPLM